MCLLLLPAILVGGSVASGVIAHSYSWPYPVTGRTRLMKCGDHWVVEAEYQWCWFLTAWAQLGYYCPLAVFPEMERDVLSPKSEGKFGWHRTAYFDTKIEARDAAIEWRTNQIVSNLTHVADGAKEQVTAPT